MGATVRIAQECSRFAAAYLVVVLLLSVFQRKLTYYPSVDSPSIPTASRLAGMEEVALTSGDGTQLAAWWWPSAASRAGAASRPSATSEAAAATHAVVVLNGNAGNRANRVGWMEPLHQEGYSIFFLDYRGYGGSDGSPTERGLYLDAQAAVDWVRAHGITSLTIVAESLGTGVGIEIASRNKLDALVLQSPYDSIVSVAARHYWWAPVDFVLRDRFDSIAKIDSVHTPVLFVHGDRDEVIPWSSGRRLYERANQPKTWVTIKGAGHDILWARPKVYFDKLIPWINATVRD